MHNLVISKEWFCQKMRPTSLSNNLMRLVFPNSEPNLLSIITKSSFRCGWKANIITYETANMFRSSESTQESVGAVVSKSIQAVSGKSPLLNQISWTLKIEIIDNTWLTWTDFDMLIKFNFSYKVSRAKITLQLGVMFCFFHFWYMLRVENIPKSELFHRYYPANISTLDQRWFNIVDHRWNRVDSTLKMKQNRELDF